MENNNWKHLLFSGAAGIAGGVFPILLASYFKTTATQAPSDVMATANTYIVFTTFIFTIAAVVLAMAGYILTQHLSKSTETHQDLLFKDLKEKVKTNEKMGIDLMQAILENPDVKRQFDSILTSKISEHLERSISQHSAVAQHAEALRASIIPGAH